jgi:hypothetical protein
MTQSVTTEEEILLNRREIYSLNCASSCQNLSSFRNYLDTKLFNKHKSTDQGLPNTRATGATFEFTLLPRAKCLGRPVVALHSLMFPITNYQIQSNSNKEILSDIFCFHVSEVKYYYIDNTIPEICSHL